MPIPEKLFWQCGKRHFIAKPELSAASIIFGGTVSSPSNMTSFLIQVWWKTLDLSCFCQSQGQTCHKEMVCATFENDCRPFHLVCALFFIKACFCAALRGKWAIHLCLHCPHDCWGVIPCRPKENAGSSSTWASFIAGPAVIHQPLPFGNQYLYVV